VMKGAKEKKRLAEQGRWDIFASVGVGLNVKKFDRKVLDYSRLKAEEDILDVQARIKDQELKIAARIRQEKGEAENRRRQLESLYESLQSREKIYRFKLESYLKGEESIDNLIRAFRSLLDTHKQCYRMGNEYFDNIRELDYLCGVYFQKLGMEIGAWTK